MRNGRPTRGYILILTLLLLLVASVSLSVVATETHKRAMEARTAEQELRTRWAFLSLQRTLLPEAAEIVESSRRVGPEASGHYRQLITLGGQEFTLMFCDEQSKANVTLLAKDLDWSELQQLLLELAGKPSGLDLQPTTKHVADDNGQTRVVRSFTSYGQLFSQCVPSSLAGEATTHITCWGDGRLNAKLATPQAMSAVMRTVLDKDEMVRVERIRQRIPGLTWREVFREASILPPQVEAMQGRVTDTSNCMSMWVISSDGRRARFAVIDRRQVTEFVW